MQHVIFHIKWECSTLHNYIAVTLVRHSPLNLFVFWSSNCASVLVVIMPCNSKNKQKKCFFDCINFEQADCIKTLKCFKSNCQCSEVSLRKRLVICFTSNATQIPEYESGLFVMKQWFLNWILRIQLLLFTPCLAFIASWIFFCSDNLFFAVQSLWHQPESLWRYVSTIKQHPPLCRSYWIKLTFWPVPKVFFFFFLLFFFGGGVLYRRHTLYIIQLSLSVDLLPGDR